MHSVRLRKPGREGLGDTMSTVVNASDDGVGGEGVDFVRVLPLDVNVCT